jgi:hypothetical protein
VAVRPEFGPTLPALLAARGVSRRAMLAGVVVLALAVVGVLVVAHRISHSRQLVVHSPLTFNFTYDRTLMHPVKAHPGELARLAGRDGTKRSIAIFARAVTLPPYTPNFIGGDLPIIAEQRIAQLRAQYPGLEILDEGKARTNDAQGYQIGFRVKTGGRRLLGRDVYALPGTNGSRTGILMSLRQYLRGKPTKADTNWVIATRVIFRSFTFGTASP